MKRLAICDFDPSLPSSERDQGPIPNALDKVGSHASPPQDTTGTHGSGDVSSSASVASASWHLVFASEGFDRLGELRSLFSPSPHLVVIGAGVCTCASHRRMLAWSVQGALRAHQK